MIDKSIAERVKENTYILEIYKAFDNDPKVTDLWKNIMQAINKIYRYLEPDFFQGELIIFSTFIDFVDDNNKTPLYDYNSLTDIRTKSVIIQVIEDELFLVSANLKKNIINTPNCLSYYYKNKSEYYYANKKTIKIHKYYPTASYYCTYFFKLQDALEIYRLRKVKRSSCTIFNKVWFDEKRIFFKAGPENDMRTSLKEHLTSSLRGVDIEVECNTNESKPVDIRINWKEANRMALIEIKWMGKSKNKNNSISNNYTDYRANQGAQQLANYMELNKTSLPLNMIKGYLIVIDGRRWQTNKNTKTLSIDNGMYYKEKDINFYPRNQFHESRSDFEKPIRMFVEPICHL